VKGITLILPSLSTVRRPRVAAGALLVAGGLALAQAVPARAAGPYVHQIECTGGGAAATTPGAVSDDDGHGWLGSASAVSGSSVQNLCAGGRGLVATLGSTSATAVPGGDLSSWTYVAPDSTKITGIQYSWNGYMRPYDGLMQGVIRVKGSRGDIDYHGGEGSITSPRSLSQMILNEDWIRVGAECEAPGRTCPAGATDAWVGIYSPRVVLWDDQNPVVGPVTGVAVSDDTWKGSKDLNYSATDQGGGLARFRVYVDGARVIDHGLDNGSGQCTVQSTQTVQGGQSAWQFGWPVPCQSSVSTTEPLDTGLLADGRHTVTAKVVDAAQNETTLYSATKVIANHPPVLQAAPAYSDETKSNASAPKPGVTLSARNDGVWSGPSLTLVHGWEQCDANGVSCAQVPGATGMSYTLTDADVGHRLRFIVTATNAADSVSAYTPLTNVVAAASSVDGPVLKPVPGADGGAVVLSPTNITKIEHLFKGHVVGEAAGIACPQDKATLVFQHVVGGRQKLGFGKAGAAQVALTCSTTGRAIADADLAIATKTGSRPVVAADVRTDGAGHATIRLGKGASRVVTVAYRMYADDALARATATLKVSVKGRVTIKANRKHLHNGQAVTLRGALAGGSVPSRGVNLAVQWRDGRRWRPFAQIKTNRKGAFKYAYRFTRTARTVVYRLRVQVTKGQIDYPFEAPTSKTVKVTVGP
jgi:hypothetical protein